MDIYHSFVMHLNIHIYFRCTPKSHTTLWNGFQCDFHRKCASNTNHLWCGLMRLGGIIFMDENGISFGSAAVWNFATTTHKLINSLDDICLAWFSRERTEKLSAFRMKLNYFFFWYFAGVRKFIKRLFVRHEKSEKNYYFLFCVFVFV